MNQQPMTQGASMYQNGASGTPVDPAVGTIGQQNAQFKKIPSPSNTQPPPRQTSKNTPISMLQELCQKLNKTPRYDLLTMEGRAHQPSFVFR